MTIENNPWQEIVIAIDEAIEQASKVMTIRQGDLIAIDCALAPRKLEKEELIQIEENNEELLYCKIK